MKISRRQLLTAGAATAAGVVVAGVGFETGHRDDTADASPSKGTEPFYGRNQPGIATAQQDRLLFAAYDLTTASRSDLRQLFQDWTAAAARMMSGADAAEPHSTPSAPPSDTGEAVGLDPAHLTLTFGFGPGLFERDGTDRYGVAARRPAALVDLPAFPHDNLDPSQSGGDLCVQACSNDPQVAYHAIRNLTRIARGTAVLRWTQQGFGRTSSTTPDQVTPRNLMGFKDGTNNIRAGQAGFDENVWVGAADGPTWMVHGSYLVARRIRIHIEVWDRSSLGDQEQTIGRDKIEGAPLGAAHEHDTVGLDAKGGDGKPTIPLDAHVRLASQAASNIHILRRGYSFTDGIAVDTGQLDAGLFFLAYQRDPRNQFIAIQRHLATDALNEYIQHVGSAVFAVPPGLPDRGRYIGDDLFA